MEGPRNRAVTAFDTLYTTNHIRILKILLPFVDEPARRNLTVLIKFLELQYTVDCLRRTPVQTPDADHDGRADIAALFAQIRDFCTPAERAALEQLARLKKNMELYEEMAGMMQLLSRSEQEDSAPLSGSPDPMELLKGMLSPEQQAMFEMFQAEEEPRQDRTPADVPLSQKKRR